MTGSEFAPVAFGLASAACWGAGDFCGGLATRRTHVYSVVIASQLVGVAMVVLGVHDLERAADLFRRVYGWPAPVTKDDVNFGRLAHFPGAPVSLAAPLHPNDFLAERLRRFDESPCAFLIGTFNLDAASNRLRLGTVSSWFDRQVFWFDAPRRHRILLGLIENPPHAEQVSLP